MDIITRVNWVDVLAVIIILRIGYVAFEGGLSHEIFPLIGGIVIIVLSLHYYTKLGQFICSNIPAIPIEVANLIGFVLLALLAGSMFKFFKIFLDKIIKVQWHPFIEKFCGMLAGVIRAFITVSIVLIFLSLVPLSYLQWSIRDRSLTGMYFLRIGPEIYMKCAKFLPAVKIGDSTVDREDVMRNLTSDKRIPSKTPPKEKKTPEWEKALRY